MYVYVELQHPLNVASQCTLHTQIYIHSDMKAYTYTQRDGPSIRVSIYMYIEFHHPRCGSKFALKFITELRNLYTQQCIHIYTYTYIAMYTYICIHICMSIYTYVQTCVYTEAVEEHPLVRVNRCQQVSTGVNIWTV